jgi:hypothetical protein
MNGSTTTTTTTTPPPTCPRPKAKAQPDMSSSTSFMNVERDYWTPAVSESGMISMTVEQYDERRQGVEQRAALNAATARAVAVVAQPAEVVGVASVEAAIRQEVRSPRIKSIFEMSGPNADGTKQVPYFECETCKQVKPRTVMRCLNECLVCYDASFVDSAQLFAAASAAKAVLSKPVEPLLPSGSLRACHVKGCTRIAIEDCEMLLKPPCKRHLLTCNLCEAGCSKTDKAGHEEGCPANPAMKAEKPRKKKKEKEEAEKAKAEKKPKPTERQR